MMRIQYEELIQKIFKLIDEELEIETEEGDQAFREIGAALFNVYMKGKKKC